MKCAVLGIKSSKVECWLKAALGQGKMRRRENK